MGMAYFYEYTPWGHPLFTHGEIMDWTLALNLIAGMLPTVGIIAIIVNQTNKRIDDLALAVRALEAKFDRYIMEGK